MLRTQLERMLSLSAALLFADASRSTNAQALRGVVRDGASARAVPGAVVSVLDSANRVAGRTITDAQGRYAFSLRFAVASVRVVRIGFRPRNLPAPAWSPSSNAKLDFELERLPLYMSVVQIVGDERCPRRDDGPRALAAWEQARTALLATVVSRDARPAMVRTRRYERRYDAQGRHWLW